MLDKGNPPIEYQLYGANYRPPWKQVHDVMHDAIYVERHDLILFNTPLLQNPATKACSQLQFGTEKYGNLSFVRTEPLSNSGKNSILLVTFALSAGPHTSNS